MAGGEPELADQTEKDIADVDRWANALMSEEPSRFPTDKEAETGKMDETTHIELPKDAEPWEILEALGGTRSEVGLALQSVAAVLEDLLEEIKRLKQHRHDVVKHYSGKPEL